jgi:hypothetical protein
VWRGEWQWEEGSGGGKEVSGDGEEGTGEEFEQRQGGRGGDEAAVMSSTGGGDELNERGMDELRDEDHEGEDEDGGEELNEVTIMTLIDGRDDLDEGCGWAHGMTMVTEMREELDTRDRMLLGAVIPSHAAAVDPGKNPTVHVLILLEMVLVMTLEWGRLRSCDYCDPSFTLVNAAFRWG